MIPSICGIKQTKQNKAQSHREQIGGCQNRKMLWGGDGEMGEVGQNIRTSSYKIGKSWGYNVQYGGI